MKYRKKPVVIDAIRWGGGDCSDVEKFCGHNFGRADVREISWLGTDDKEHLIIWNSLESQWLCCPVGHWIIRGIKGELYPCENEVFEATCEPINTQP